MATAFISAANSVTGLHLAAHLRARGWSVVAQIGVGEDEEPLRAMGVKVFAADLALRWIPLDILPRDVDVIFHLTDLDPATAANERRLEDQLVNATHGLLVAAADTQCRVFIHQSPAQVYLPVNGHPFTEADAQAAAPGSAMLIRLAQQAERRVRHSGQRGLETLIVNTGLCVGPGSALGWMGLFDMLAAGDIGKAPRGSTTVSDPVAIAPALVRAAEIGRNGDHFLLGGDCVPVDDLLAFMAEQIGVSAPAAARSATGLLGSITRKLGVRPATLGRELVTLLDGDCRFDDSHARDVLGYAPRDAETIIAEAAVWWLGSQAVPASQ